MRYRDRKTFKFFYRLFRRNGKLATWFYDLVAPLFGIRRAKVGYDWWERGPLTLRELNRQKRCNHLKGNTGFVPPHGLVKDYNVSLHTFVDRSQRIRCNGCGWVVWNRPEYSFKWKEGLRMVDSSTNRQSSSEIISGPYPNVPSEVGWQDRRATHWAPEHPAANNENPIRGLAVNRKKDK